MPRKPHAPLLLALALCAIAAPVHAQTPPATDADIWATEVVVVGQAKGPALWKVVKGDTVVWILGAPNVTPANLNWDTQRLDKILTGADALYLPPSATGGIGSLIKALSSMGLPHGQTLKAVTDPADYQRFLTLAARYNLKPSDYDRKKPFWAGIFFQNAVYKKAQYNGQAVSQTVIALAKSHQVKVKTIASYKVTPLLDEVNHLSVTEGQTCFHEALDNIDFIGAHVGEMSSAWATGEVKTLARVASSAPARTCLEDGAAVSDFKTHSEDDSFSRIKAAMLSTKRSVVILPIAMLTGDGNLIARLRQEGFAVQLPRSLQ